MLLTLLSTTLSYQKSIKLLLRFVILRTDSYVKLNIYIMKKKYYYCYACSSSFCMLCTSCRSDNL